MSASTDWRIISSCSNLQWGKRRDSGRETLCLELDVDRGTVSYELGFEVVCGQFGVVDLQQDVGVADGGGVDLKTSCDINTDCLLSRSVLCSVLQRLRSFYNHHPLTPPPTANH